MRQGMLRVVLHEKDVAGYKLKDSTAKTKR